MFVIVISIACAIPPTHSVSPRYRRRPMRHAGGGTRRAQVLRDTELAAGRAEADRLQQLFQARRRDLRGLRQRVARERMEVRVGGRSAWDMRVRRAARLWAWPWIGAACDFARHGLFRVTRTARRIVRWSGRGASRIARVVVACALARVHSPSMRICIRISGAWRGALSAIFHVRACLTPLVC